MFSVMCVHILREVGNRYIYAYILVGVEWWITSVLEHLHVCTFVWWSRPGGAPGKGASMMLFTPSLSQVYFNSFLDYPLVWSCDLV